MDRRTSSSQATATRNTTAQSGADSSTRSAPQPSPGSPLNAGAILVQTLRHFWPELNDWIDKIDDPRFEPFITYDKRFLMYWGFCLFLFKLGSRRQADFQLDVQDTHVLDNINRLAGTKQTTRPVHNTLNYFLGRIGAAALAALRTAMVQRLLRMKVLEDARLQRCYRIIIDGTGYLMFRYPHCKHCLKQQHGEVTLYMHQALEAKLVGPGGLVISIATEFIDNRDLADTPADADSEQRKQDCELKALKRLLARLREEFPQLAICICGDGLYACGTVMQLAKDYKLSYVVTFKEGRLPALWQEFQSLLTQCPENYVKVITPAQVQQEYRWVNMSYTDSEGRTWTFTAIQCRESTASGTTTWAWLTGLKVTRNTVIEVATKGGRARWHIENEGFNTQKNSDLNLEHAYSRQYWEAYYYLLQIAHIVLQLVEKGSLLQRLAKQAGKTVLGLFGSLKNIAERLRESFRRLRLPDEVYDRERARRMQIRLDSS